MASTSNRDEQQPPPSEDTQAAASSSSSSSSSSRQPRASRGRSKEKRSRSLSVEGESVKAPNPKRSKTVGPPTSESTVLEYTTIYKALDALFEQMTVLRPRTGPKEEERANMLALAKTLVHKVLAHYVVSKQLKKEVCQLAFETGGSDRAQMRATAGASGIRQLLENVAERLIPRKHLPRAEQKKLSRTEQVKQAMYKHSFEFAGCDLTSECNAVYSLRSSQDESMWKSGCRFPHSELVWLTDFYYSFLSLAGVHTDLKPESHDVPAEYTKQKYFFNLAMTGNEAMADEKTAPQQASSSSDTYNSAPVNCIGFLSSGKDVTAQGRDVIAKDIVSGNTLTNSLIGRGIKDATMHDELQEDFQKNLKIVRDLLKKGGALYEKRKSEHLLNYARDEAEKEGHENLMDERHHRNEQARKKRKQQEKELADRKKKEAADREADRKLRRKERKQTEKRRDDRERPHRHESARGRKRSRTPPRSSLQSPPPRVSHSRGRRRGYGRSRGGGDAYSRGYSPSRGGAYSRGGYGRSRGGGDAYSRSPVRSRSCSRDRGQPHSRSRSSSQRDQPKQDASRHSDDNRMDEDDDMDDEVDMDDRDDREGSRRARSRRS